MKKLFKTSLLAALLGWATAGFADVTPIKFHRENIGGETFSGMFPCERIPQFQYLLKKGGVMDLQVAVAEKSEDRWAEDAVNDVIMGYFNGFVQQHNNDPNSPFPDYNIEDCELEYGHLEESLNSLDGLQDVDILLESIFYGVGIFGWSEQPSPFQNLQQIKVEHSYAYGGYPRAYGQYVILDLQNKKVLNIKDLINLTPAAKKIIHQAYRNTWNAKLWADMDDAITENLQNLNFDNNMAFEKDGVVFWFAANSPFGYSVPLEVKIPYKKINPYLKPQYRR